MKTCVIFLLCSLIGISCAVSPEPADTDVEKIVKESYKPEESLWTPMGSPPSINSLFILDKKRKNRKTFNIVSVVKGTSKIWIQHFGNPTSHFIDTVKFEMYKRKDGWEVRNITRKTKTMLEPFWYTNANDRVIKIKE